jgi:hypothetical protein
MSKFTSFDETDPEDWIKYYKSVSDAIQESNELAIKYKSKKSGREKESIELRKKFQIIETNIVNLNNGLKKMEISKKEKQSRIDLITELKQNKERAYLNFTNSDEKYKFLFFY